MNHPRISSGNGLRSVTSLLQASPTFHNDLPCQPGRFRVPQSNCQKCFPGTYTTTFQGGLCKICPEGKYQPLFGSRKCIWCQGSDTNVFPETKVWKPSTRKQRKALKSSKGSVGPSGCNLTPAPTPIPTKGMKDLDRLQDNEKSPEARDSPTSELSYYIARIETGKLRNMHLSPPQFRPSNGYQTRAGKMAACLLNQAQVVMHNHYIQSTCLRGLMSKYPRPCMKHNAVKQLVSQIPACCCGDKGGCTFVGHLDQLFTWEAGCQKTVQPVYNVLMAGDLLDYSYQCTEKSNSDFCKRGMVLAVKAMKSLMTAAQNLYTLVPNDESKLAREFINVCDQGESYKTCGAKSLSYFMSARWSSHSNNQNKISDQNAASLLAAHKNIQSLSRANAVPTPLGTNHDPAPTADDDANPRAPSPAPATQVPTSTPTLRPTIATLQPTPWHAVNDNNYGGSDDDWIANLGKDARNGKN